MEKMRWYPENEKELNSLLKKYFSHKTPKTELKKIHGLIVPHAGYAFSGEIAGKAYALLKNTNKKIKRVILLGPSHYQGFHGVKTLSQATTPLGEVNILKNNFQTIEYEHSLENQFPFIQYINKEIEILPLAIGEITDLEAQQLAKELLELNSDTVYIFSTDLSHFQKYNQALEQDRKTIETITNLDIKNPTKNIDACGVYPLLVCLHLCKMKGYKPQLIEYKNSGDITGDKDSVVGYSSFVF